MIDLDDLRARVKDAESNAMGDVADFSRDVLELIAEVERLRAAVALARAWADRFCECDSCKAESPADDDEVRLLQAIKELP